MEKKEEEETKKDKAKRKERKKKIQPLDIFFSLLLLSFLLHTHHQICESISWTGDLKTHWNIWKGIEFKDLKEPS